jgi:hypothetical protein
MYNHDQNNQISLREEAYGKKIAIHLSGYFLFVEQSILSMLSGSPYVV